METIKNRYQTCKDAMRKKYFGVMQELDLLMNHELVNLMALYKRKSVNEQSEIELWHYFEGGGLSIHEIMERISRKVETLQYGDIHDMKAFLPNEREDSLQVISLLQLPQSEHSLSSLLSRIKTFVNSATTSISHHRHDLFAFIKKNTKFLEATQQKLFFQLDANVRQLDVDGMCALLHTREQIWTASENDIQHQKNIFIAEFAIRKQDLNKLYPNDRANNIKLFSYFQLLLDLFMFSGPQPKHLTQASLVLNVIDDGSIFFMDCEKGVVFKEEFYSVHQGANIIKMSNDVFASVKGFLLQESKLTSYFIPL